MEIFHWVANELKNVDIFSTEMQKADQHTGAAYNDFDNETPFPSDDEELVFPFTDPSSSSLSLPVNDHETVLQNVNDSEVVFFDIEDFDDTSDYPDNIYRRRVYNVIKNHFDIDMTEDIINIYHSRQMNNWEGADSVYDSWLLGMRKSRDWFPIEVFEAEYPDYTEIIDDHLKRRSLSSPDKSDASKQSSSEMSSDASQSILGNRPAMKIKQKRKIVSSQSEENEEEEELDTKRFIQLVQHNESIVIDSDEEEVNDEEKQSEKTTEEEDREKMKIKKIRSGLFHSYNTKIQSLLNPTKKMKTQLIGFISKSRSMRLFPSTLISLRINI